MRYLGGKMRQSKVIVREVARYDFDVYVEPFMGALWSATAVMQQFPNKKYLLNDVNPFLVCFWKESLKGWNPPEHVSEETYIKYNKSRPVDDPMTGYIGFAWSFGGKFFGGAARTSGKIKGSYASTRRKIEILRSCSNVQITCGDYGGVKVPIGRVLYYMDPPYVGRTPQQKMSSFDPTEFSSHCKSLASKHIVLMSEFVDYVGSELLHSWGDTVVRHLNAKPRDGTVEMLMRVRP